MTAYYNEHDPKAAAWLRELIRRGLIAHGDVDERSITDVVAADLVGYTQCHFFAGIGGWSYALRLAGWTDDRPVWTGSPPCQPFSSAGRGMGRNDARHLGPHFVSLVRACRPGVLFGEQVASAAVFGKVAGGARKPPEGEPAWAWIDDLCDRLEAARYAVGASDIPAASVGAKHIRQRTFFGAIWLADDIGIRRQAIQRQGNSGLDYLSNDKRTRNGSEPSSADHRPSPHDGFWRDADWLFCRDGKWRPVEPGTFPLAHGVSARVGRLRGYGNAIVPQAAAEFIAAFSEAAEL